MKPDEIKILIVDDERYNINVLVDILKPDYRTIVAKNGEEALKRTMTAPLPDLILLDIMMPGMDGYEVCRQLKSDPKTCFIPVIFITAMTETEDETKGLELGAIDYITKPVSPPIVRARVKNHLALKLALEKIETQKEKLDEQNKALIEAARLREDVERITRHDIKTPLNAVIGFSQFLMMADNLTDAQLDGLKTIEDAGYRILNIINLSVDLFKMERGIYPFTPAIVNLLLVINKIIIETRELVRLRNLSVNVSIKGIPVDKNDIFTVQGDELLCYSMLANLIKNALEASPEGETISIILDEDEDAALITIHNKGVVPVDIRENFFDIYVTSGKETGTGLGTYSAKLIAETQNGRISMTTSETEGTYVTIKLPK
ncbi:Two component system response regulator/histidine kinase [Desulfonema limicola]|uniref:histidine kinase n=1 Tax=Desulfonema limicola TaxID=45656 RepID=A0A975GIW4_9BACT|nr:hybrid sensor histidine kinase/response regulator [Desulfonema limicola]QTA82992.1 Two component system response regulator/histidine kinase [Desulfonema limicola]